MPFENFDAVKRVQKSRGNEKCKRMSENWHC